MPKSSKRFILSNSNLNVYGFRMLTSGADLEQFKKNPIMLFNHIRSYVGSTKETILPIGHWQDIEINGDEISAVPFFDDQDEFAMQLYHKVENGTIRMASAGAAPIDTSEDLEDLLPGQRFATYTKWKMIEASITDIGANDDALAVALYDSNDNLIKLNNQNLINILTPLATNSEVMKIVTVNLSHPEVIAKLGLNDAAGAPEVMAAIDNMVKLTNDQRTEIQTLKTEKETAEGKVTTLTAQVEEQKITTLLNQAITDRKILEGQREHYAKLAKADFETVKTMLDGMQAAPTVESQLETKTAEGDEAKYAKLSFDDLHKSGDLAKVKLSFPDLYKTKFKEKFGKEPQNS